MSYTERRRRRSREWLVTAVVIAVALVASVLVSARVVAADDPCNEPRAAPSDETALLPRGLSFDGIGTVTNVAKAERNVTVHAVTTKPVDEVTVLIQNAVTAAGYRFTGMDSEASEAEVFFSLGSYAGGQANVRPSACAGRSDIELVLLDPDAVPAPTTTS